MHIQGNPLGLKEPEIRLFAVWDIANRRYWSVEEMRERFAELSQVEIVKEGPAFPALTDEQLRQMAEGLYPNGRQREGIVIRTAEAMTPDHRLSFKVINLLYKEG